MSYLGHETLRPETNPFGSNEIRGDRTLGQVADHTLARILSGDTTTADCDLTTGELLHVLGVARQMRSRLPDIDGTDAPLRTIE